MFAVAVVTVVVHRPVLSAQALTFDDDEYLTKNSLVQNPSWASVRRFLQEVRNPSTVPGYYQPLTMISLMLDCAMGGTPDDLRVFHRTSLALHVVNTALVILLLYLLFRHAIAAALAGLLFAVHPLTVEPIAWVADRKTLLTTLFVLASLILYVRHTQTRGWRAYVAALVTFVLALMSKPTSTPLPVLLLVLDWWPLRRLSRGALLEKIPFFLVAGVFAGITVLSQGQTTEVKLRAGYSAAAFPLVACHNIIFYLYKVVRPLDLSVIYPFPDPISMSSPMVRAGVIGTCILIGGLLVSLRWTRALVAGWLFFFLAIVPTLVTWGYSLGIASDKYMYQPSVGLLIIAAWILNRPWEAHSRAGTPARTHTAAILVVAILATLEARTTHRQLDHWQDTEKLCMHMWTLAPDSAPVHLSIGSYLDSQGRLDEAIEEYRQAIGLEPDYLVAYNNLGILLARREKMPEAIENFQTALLLNPNVAGVRSNLGNALALQGKMDAAIEQYREAIRLAPLDLNARCNLAFALRAKGNVDKAVQEYREVLRIDPACDKARKGLEDLLSSRDRAR